jgi:undecaprenyl diphosphate synthase
MTPATAALTNGEGPLIPRHVAIIMDGNGRWAKSRRLPRVAGHKRGVEALRKVVKAAPDLGISVLTIYAFSSENWKRPADEVSDLMGLLRFYLQNEIGSLHANGVRVEVIGDYCALQPDLVRLIEHARALTRDNRRLTLVVALNYGAQDEITRAVRAVASEVKAGTLAPEAIDIDAISSRLDTRNLPPPDLVVRTSGELRLSNFLLWQAAYAELVFVDTLWPDFDGESLADAVREFGRRDRRFGGA